MCEIKEKTETLKGKGVGGMEGGFVTGVEVCDLKRSFPGRG